MASSAERYVIVMPDGSLAADIYGNPAEFTSREEAERWLMAGERVERQADPGVSGASPDQ
jgi:hypothetical protein